IEQLSQSKFQIVIPKSTTHDINNVSATPDETARRLVTATQLQLVRWLASSTMSSAEEQAVRARWRSTQRKWSDTRTGQRAASKQSSVAYRSCRSLASLTEDQTFFRNFFRNRRHDKANMDARHQAPV